MRLLLLNNSELEYARLFESDRSATMELIGSNELLDQVLLSIVDLVEHQLPGAMCSVSILRESYQTGAAPHLPAGYHREILEVVNGGAGMPTSIGDNPQDPVLINDIANDARVLPYREITLRHGLRSCWLSPVTASDGKPLGTVSIYHRHVCVAGSKELAILRKAAQLAAVAAEQRSLFEQLTQQARMDPLTELPNRLLFQDRLQNCLADARSERSQAAVLWVDLDRFKQINDTLGHRAGDLLLRQAARILTNAAGPGATVARIGGDEFTAAEEAGLIVAIGKWVLHEACRSAADWMRSEARCFTIAVNVSFLQLIRDNFTEEVQDALRKSGLPPGCLELELTESFLMQNASESNQQIERLRGLGIRVSIDDFGTGYSSLSYLQHLRVDAVKIDRSFVSEVTHRSSSAVSLIQAIVAMAHELKLKTVVEGVETEHQLEILKSIGCDLMQGYLIQRPMPAGDVVSYLRQGNRQIQAAA